MYSCLVILEEKLIKIDIPDHNINKNRNINIKYFSKTQIPITGDF